MKRERKLRLLSTPSTPLKYTETLSQNFATLINASIHFLFQRRNINGSSWPWLEQQQANGPRALPSPCKDYQFALVTTNLLPSRSFCRVLYLGTVAGLRLLCCQHFGLPTKEITGDWQAGPHSVRFFCKRDSVCPLEQQPSSFSLQIPDTWRASF